MAQQSHAQSEHAEAPHAHYKEYFVIFVLLAALTAAEIGCVYLKGTIGVTPVVVALIAMALGKAALVGLFYMHLKHETNVLKLTVAIPLSLPLFYALVLIAEASWRLLRGEAPGGMH